MVGIESFLPILIPLAGNPLGIELLFHIVPRSQEAIEGEAGGRVTTYDGRLAINFGDGVTHEFVIFQEGVEKPPSLV